MYKFTSKCHSQNVKTPILRESHKKGQPCTDLQISQLLSLRGGIKCKTLTQCSDTISTIALTE